MLIIGGIVALVLVAGFVLLAVIGRPTDAYVLFVSGPLVTTVVGGVLARKVQAVEHVARTALSATAEMVPVSALVAASQRAPAPTRAPAAAGVVDQVIAGQRAGS